MKKPLVTSSLLLMLSSMALAHPGHGTTEHQLTSAGPVWIVGIIGLVMLLMPLIANFLKGNR